MRYERLLVGGIVRRFELGIVLAHDSLLNDKYGYEDF